MSSIKEQNKSTNINSKKKVTEPKRNKKCHQESDSDSDDSFISENDSEMDSHEYRKFVSKIFPSKHMDKKIKAGEKLKKVLKEDKDKNKRSKNIKEDKKEDKQKSNKKKQIIESEEEEEEDSDSNYVTESSEESEEEESEEEESEYETTESSDQEDEDEEEEEEEEEPVKSTKGIKENKFNIIFTIGDKHSMDEEEWMTEDEENESEETETEDEDESVSSVEKDEKKQNKKKQNKKIENKKIEKKIDQNKDSVLEKLVEMSDQNKDNKMLSKCIELYEKTKQEELKVQKQKEQKQKDKNARIFKKILKDKNTLNDFTFFQKMAIDSQIKIIKEMKEINKINRIEKPYKMSILEADIPHLYKAVALKKISCLKYMDPGSGEYYKIKNWLDTFMRIPFGKFENLPISMADGVEKCHEFMFNAQKVLNDAVYGLNDAKMQIMQMMGQLITNPEAIGSAIAITGAMGTGKTSLVREGISKILNRPFAFIALGGATDSSFLEGHSYTYEGSVWGKIVQIIIDSKCMNPVIYFDELDKVSGTPKGDEIIGILTHLTDTSQNTQFHDKYFSEIDFDLSKCLFIFSYNDESLVNPILRDRMYKIQTKGYNAKQKTVIVNKHLLPKICEQVKFANEDIIIPDDSIHYIIDKFCQKEEGVRTLKRCIEIIYTKLNLYRLMKPDTNLFEEDMAVKVSFPFTVTKDIVDKLIKRTDTNSSAMQSLYI